MSNISRKNILITGATSGLGLRLAHLYAKENVNLLLCGLSSTQKVSPRLPKGVNYVAADQSRDDCVKIIRQKIETLGWKKIDNAILVAGTGETGSAIDQSSESIITTMKVNLVTTVSIVHFLAEYLNNANGKRSDQSCITLIGSTAYKGASEFASYAASKAGLTGFTRSLSSEWNNKAIIQIIHPGPTATGMHEKIGFDAGFARKFFLNPDYSARKIKQIVETRKPIGVVSFNARIGDKFRSIFGAGISTEKILP